MSTPLPTEVLAEPPWFASLGSWGIPMATDIAFVVGCLALFGSRVPQNLWVLLLSLAIIDDIGAIIVIAIGYTENLDYGWLPRSGLVQLWVMVRDISWGTIAYRKIQKFIV